MLEFFKTILYEPILNAFVFLYDYIPDVGVVIFILTLVIKLILHPLTKKSVKAQQSMAELQPKMQEVKTKYKDDQQKQAQEMMKLYKEHKVNPVGSCLPILIQIPIFITLYYVLRTGLTGGGLDLLYSFVPNPGSIDPIAFGFIDMSKPNIVLAILAGGAQFLQGRFTIRKQPPKAAGAGAKDENMMAMMNKQMLYVMPILTVFIGLSLPSGLALYWFLSALFMALQQWHAMRKPNPPPPGVIEGKVE